MVNQAILTKDRPLADVLYGIDNTFLSRALEAGIFEPYESPALEAVPPDLQLDPEHRVTPIDTADVCLNIDREAFADRRPAGPRDARRPARPGPGGHAGGGGPGHVLARAGLPAGHHRRLRRGPRVRLAGLLGRPARQRRAGRVGLGGGLLRRLLRRLRRGRPAPRRLLRLEPGGRGRLRPRPGSRRVAHGGAARPAASARSSSRASCAAPTSRSWPPRSSTTCWHPQTQAELPLAMFVYPARSDVALPEVFTRHALRPQAPLSLGPGGHRRRSRGLDPPVDGHRAAVTRSAGPAAGGSAAGLRGPLLPVAGGQHPGPRRGAGRRARPGQRRRCLAAALRRSTSCSSRSAWRSSPRP